MPEYVVKLRGQGQPAPLPGDPAAGTLTLSAGAITLDRLVLDPPVAGTVYGTLLNYRGALAALGPAMEEPPYRAPPKAVVLYIKTANTRIGHGRPIPLPDRVEAVEIGAALGIVIGRTASRVSEAEALYHVRGYTIVTDVTVPHDSVYRPPVRFRCRDGFCPIGPWIVDRADLPDPDALGVRVRINGEIRQSATTRDLVRPVARLIAEVTDFMTLRPGDVLHVGVPEAPPLARAGDRVRVEIDGIGWLENPVVPEAEALPERETLAGAAA